MAQTRTRRSTGTAVVAADCQRIGLGLYDAGSNRTNTGTAGQFYANAGVAVGIFQIKNQFCQIFDGIDVVMGRRGNEGNARRSMTRLGNIRIDLAAWQVAAFARLGPLGALDLQLIGVDEVIARNTETGRGNLLDFVVCICCKAVCIFAAFAGIAQAAQTVHGLGYAFVGFLAEGTVAHGTCTEAFDNAVFCFDLFNRDTAAGRVDEFQEVPQAVHGGRIDELGILTVQLVVIGAAGLLQEFDGFRRNDVLLAVFPVLIDVAPGQAVFAVKGCCVTAGIFFGYFFQANAANRAGRIDEILLNQLAANADGFKNLGAVVAVYGRNAHFRHDGQNPVD